ncbi:GroES-like protein [Gloeophyllum trabeum ATCC 11539]|uniref:GroES-like protein n=1 Tax=Gloeophyllum trabeum (strain ATCC 11539 / FP-39264 / Madison 617) TaxID=670483 RepID=S7Q6P7_GLOTA|nr:GroES-like protein [Gloeophyllum trabeum ATCC 11539]EPQ55103.1 GroES-like protein [Gloeophyllum trabeum ATCC 11539]
MSSQKALFLQGPQGSFVVGDKPVPSPGEGDLLIKVDAAALNPLDWKIQKGFTGFVDDFPAVLGADLAGTVVEVGEGVTHFAKGDRVITQGAYTPDRAGYQQYALAVGEFSAKLPPQISFDEGASIPSAALAAGFGLYLDVNESGPGGAGLTPPWEAGGPGKYSGKPILILGGASSLGQLAIQFAKLSGFSPIIVTASPRNESLLKSLGATHVIDRSLQTEALRSALSAATTAPIDLIFDAVSLSETQQAAYDLLSPGGTLALTLPPTINVDSQARKRVFFIRGIAHIPELRKDAANFFAALEGLLANGHIKPNPVRVLPDGLKGVAAGLKELEEGRVSGQKLVARPHETPV